MLPIALPPEVLADPNDYKPTISEYRNYFAVIAGLDLGKIDLDTARVALKLRKDQSPRDVDVRKLDGYQGSLLSFVRGESA